MNRYLLLTVLIAVGLCATLVSFRARYRAEARNRAVELVVDYADAQALANTRSRAIDDVLTQLRSAGITTVAVTEETLGSLYGSGIVTYRRDGDNTIISFAPGFETQELRVIQAMDHKTKLHIVSLGSHQFQVDAPWPQFNGTPIGLDDDIVRSVRRNNLLVAPRLLNFTGVTPANIAWELQQVKSQCGAGELGPFIFSGAAVLGYRGRIDDTAHVLRDLGLVYGSVEFAKTFGDDDLSRAAAANTVRVHSIGLDEIGGMTEPTAVERFTLATRERNIRVCYIRLFVNGLEHDPDAIHANTEFVRTIVAGLTHSVPKLTPQGPAHAFRDDPSPGRVLRLTMALGVAAGIVMLILVFTGSGNPGFWPLLIAAVVIAEGLAWPGSTAKGREVLALFAACSFPVLSLCARPIRCDIASTRSTAGALGSAVLEYLRITLITFAGVLFVVGLLNGRLFFLKIDEFLGVKSVLVVPILLCAAFYGLGLAELDPSASWSDRRALIRERLGRLSGQPLLVGWCVAGLIGLAALAVLVARSGNDSAVAVSETELKMRAILDRVLGVRPRTKEFLFGHPTLLIGLALARSGRGRRFVPWLVALGGAIGQSSFLDTFCHLHTPLYISLLRGVLGWVIGGLIGLAVYAAMARVGSKREAARLAEGT